MSKRHLIMGAYTKSYRKVRPQATNPVPSHKRIQPNKLAEFKLEVKKFTEIAKKYVDMVGNYMWTAYSTMSGSYVTILFIVGVFLLSLLLPDISQKLHKNSELKAMKNVINHMTDEVNRAEVACLTATEEMSSLHCALCDDGTETTQEHRNMSVCTSPGLLTTQSEPVQVEKKVGLFHRLFTLNQNVSKKEIAIKSILYTDSFDSQKNLEDEIA